ALWDIVTEFWPFVVVDEWEQGVPQVFGRVVKRGWLSWLADKLKMPFRAENGALLPGLYFVIPWFTHIEPVDTVPAPIGTPMLNITLKSGKTLSFSVTAVVSVSNPILAVTRVDDYEESASELVTARLAEKLADVDAARVDPENRRRLLVDLLRWCNEETEEYGVRVHSLRFTNFAFDQRAYRLLMDTALGSAAW
ncbi:MAG: SPFH domain-containing protein, partial [Planctomycetota bacterium]